MGSSRHIDLRDTRSRRALTVFVIAVLFAACFIVALVAALAT
jgi:hypothetical protein